MSFFEELSEIGESFDIKFSVSKGKDILSVVVTNESENVKLPPIAFSGDPKMIDKVFMNTIISRLSDAQKLFVQTEEFDKAIEKAKKAKSTETDVVPEQTKEDVGYEAPKEDEPPKVVTSPKFKKDINANDGEKPSEQKEPADVNKSDNENAGRIEDEFDDEW